MKVRLLTSLSGADGSFGFGEDYECSEKEAYNLIKAEMAEITGKNAEERTRKLFAKLEEKATIKEAEEDIKNRELNIENQYGAVEQAEKDLAKAKAALKSRLDDVENAEAVKNIEAKAKAEAEAKAKAEAEAKAKAEAEAKADVKTATKKTTKKKTTKKAKK